MLGVGRSAGRSAGIQVFQVWSYWVSGSGAFQQAERLGIRGRYVI